MEHSSKYHFFYTTQFLYKFRFFRYYAKKETQDSLYNNSKKQYCEQRGVLWNPINKRPNKLRDRLKELEDNLIHNKIVFYTWESNKLSLLLSTGLVAVLTINTCTGDVNSISFDKQLSTKLQVNIICDGNSHETSLKPSHLTLPSP